MRIEKNKKFGGMTKKKKCHVCVRYVKEFLCITGFRFVNNFCSKTLTLVAFKKDKKTFKKKSTY